MQPKYQEYSLDELYEVYESVDRDKHPDRFKRICEEIQTREPENIETNDEPEKECKLPVRKVDENGNYIPNSISPVDRLWNIIFAIGFTLYGAYGIFIDDLYIPSKRGGMHLSGESAWIMYAALICGCIYFLSIVVDHYDKRDNEIKYYMFGKNVKYLGLAMAMVAIFYPLFQG